MAQFIKFETIAGTHYTNIDAIIEAKISKSNNKMFLTLVLGINDENGKPLTHHLDADQNTHLIEFLEYHLLLNWVRTGVQ